MQVKIEPSGAARPGTQLEVVLAVGPAFGAEIDRNRPRGRLSPPKRSQTCGSPELHSKRGQGMVERMLKFSEIGQRMPDRRPVSERSARSRRGLSPLWFSDRLLSDRLVFVAYSDKL